MLSRILSLFQKPQIPYTPEEVAPDAPPVETTIHEWVSADNSRVKNGSVCMKCFAISALEPEQLAPVEGECPIINPHLHDCPLRDGKYYDWCVSCGELSEIPEPELHHPDTHYCGASPRCCP